MDSFFSFATAVDKKRYSQCSFSGNILFVGLLLLKFPLEQSTLQGVSKAMNNMAVTLRVIFCDISGTILFYSFLSATFMFTSLSADDAPPRVVMGVARDFF